jgi:hypothetical protein
MAIRFNTISNSDTKENYLSYITRHFTQKHMRELNMSSQLLLQTLTRVNSLQYIPIKEKLTYDERRLAFQSKLEFALNFQSNSLEHMSDVKIDKFDNKIDECPICYNTILNNELVQLECSHQYCITFINDTINLMEDPKCALCRKIIKNIYFKKEET